MIENPANDRACLDQFTKDAREMARSTRAYKLAAQLRTKRNVIAWLQSKPQLDDDGSERVQVTVCDVPQRDRLFSDTPNCIERARDAAILFEVIDPKGRYKLVTIEKPLRHTALVEWDATSKKWEPVDLFPRRNASVRNISWGDAAGYGKTAVQYVHPVGKAVLGYFGAGALNPYIEQGWQAAGVLEKPKPATPATPAKPATPAPAPARPASQPAAVARPAVVAAPPEMQLPPATTPSAPTHPLDQGGSDAAEEPAPAAIWWPPRTWTRRPKEAP